MLASDLKPGDALLLAGRGLIETPIETIEGGKFCHAAMVVFDSGWWVYEMTWPTLQRTELAAWLKQHSPVFAAPLRTVLGFAEEIALAAWWRERLGKWYDVPELLALGAWEPAKRFLSWAKLGWLIPPPPVALNGVCSVNCGWAWQAIGLDLGRPAPSLTPADVPNLPFLAPVESVET